MRPLDSEDATPDGKQIVFSVYTLELGKNKIFVMNQDGSEIRQVTSDLNWEACFHPSWSPDGQQIAFSCRARGTCPGGASSVGAPWRCMRRIFVISAQNPAKEFGPNNRSIWSRSILCAKLTTTLRSNSHKPGLLGRCPRGTRKLDFRSYGVGSTSPQRSGQVRKTKAPAFGPKRERAAPRGHRQMCPRETGPLRRQPRRCVGRLPAAGRRYL